MDLSTTVIDGVEYVLVPKALVEPKEEIQPQTEAHTIGLEGFETVETTNSIDPVVEIESVQEEQVESVRIVESPEMVGVKKAEGKTSEYRQKFLSHALLPHDVMTFPTVGQSIKEYTDTKEIKAADFGNRIPPGKWGFYGPGVEVDTY